MITYSFDINQLEICPLLNGLEKVVTRIQYTYTGTDEDNISVTLPGGVDMSEPTPENFKSFDSLTKEEVIIWLESAVDTTLYKMVIDNSIEEKKTPKYVPVKSPWETIETTTTTEAPIV